MFEYINQGFYLLSGMIVIISVMTLVENYNRNVEKVEKDAITFLSIFMIIFAVGVPIIPAYVSKVKNDENINYFKKNFTLECRSGFKLYVVSKDRDWEIIKKNSFTKSDLLIRADGCDLNKEIDK